MVGTKLIGGWVAVALALLTFAGGAAGTETQPFPPDLWSFQVQGTHGYIIWAVAGEDSRSSRGEIQIFAGNRHGRVIYTAPASVSESTLQADLGALGRVALEAKPTGVEKVVRSSCDTSFSYEPVRYVGEFRFKGEEAYTGASANSLSLRLKPLIEGPCLVYEELKLGGPAPGAGLHIGSGGRPPRVEASARTNGPGKPVEVSASIREERGEIEIERSVGGYFAPSAFGYDQHLNHAYLQPPEPFSGRGLFRREVAAANRWTGNLEVDFPGRSNVALTGNRLRPVLRHGEWRHHVTHVRAGLAAPTLPAWPSTKP